MVLPRLSSLRFAATLALAAPALADFPLTEDDFFAPMPTVLSASRLSQPLTEAPVAMTVIDREMIEASSAVDVTELLRLVPGFQVARKEGIDAVASYHGFADNFPRRLQVLIDGRSVYDPGVSGVLWSALPLTLNQIERIEVVRGSNAAAFGSNAVLGTINIVTRAPEASERLYARALTGGADGYAGEISHAGEIGALHYRLDASRGKDSGFVDKSDDSFSSIVNFQGSYRPNLDDHLTMRTGVRETDFDSESFRYPRKRVYESNYQQLVWDRVLDVDQDVRLQVYRNAFEAPDKVDIASALPGRIDYSLQTYRYDVELQHRWRLDQDWRVSWGAGLRRDVVKGGLYDTNASLDRDQIRGFSNVEWRAADDLVLNFGLMVEEYDDLGSFFSPRIAGNWLFGTGQALRAGVARAYRVPTFLEQRGWLTFDPAGGGLPQVPLFQGSAGIDSERLDSFEVGYLQEVPALNGSFDLRLFYNEIEPIIDDVEIEGSAPAPGLPDRREFQEVGTLRLKGFEAQARLRPFDGNLIHLAYAYADADGRRIDSRDPDGNRLASESNDDKVPKHTLTALVSQRLPDDWQVSATYSYVSEMAWMGEGGPVDERGRLDAKLSKRLRSADGHLQLTLNVQNLFDDVHYEYEPPDPTVPLPGNRAERRLYFQVEYHLH